MSLTTHFQYPDTAFQTSWSTLLTPSVIFSRCFVQISAEIWTSLSNKFYGFSPTFHVNPGIIPPYKLTSDASGLKRNLMILHLTLNIRCCWYKVINCSYDPQAQISLLEIKLISMRFQQLLFFMCLYFVDLVKLHMK